MKKSIFSVIIIILCCHVAYAQDYIVTYLKGHIYHDHQLVKLHDRLKGASELTSDDRGSEIALFSLQKGKLRLTFQNSKPIVNAAAEQQSELFRLVVESYIMTYTTEKTLTTRGDFDLETFLNDTTGKSGNRIYLLENELLPAPKTTGGLSIGLMSGNDTTCTAIRRQGSYLVFDEPVHRFFHAADTPVTLSCIIVKDIKTGDGYRRQPLSGPLKVTFISKTYLQGLINTYAAGLTSYYHGDKPKMTADIQDQLDFYYGRNYTPAVQQVLKTDETQ